MPTPGTIAIIILVVLILAVIVSCIQIVQQSKAYVVERLGAFHSVWGVGLHFKLPFIERVVKKVSLKEQVADFDPQPVITKDNVTMQIDTVIYFQITDPKLYTYGVEYPMSAIENLTATTLRNIIGELELDQSLTSRDTINAKMRSILDEATDPWGIKVNRVELKNILPPREIQNAMEKQMKAERERRESILQAEGEKASKVLIAEGLFTSQEEIDNSPRQDFGAYGVGDVKYKDVNNDGVVNSNDFVWSDKPYFPEIQFGFGGSVKYKKWDASIMFQGSSRYDITTYNNHPFCDNQHFGYGIVKYIADDHWSWDNNNKDAKYPRLTTVPSDNNTQASTLYMHDASFVRLKNAEIGFTYKFVRFYLQGNNLFYISKFKYWDPEKGRGNGLTYPLQRTVKAGFQFTF